MTNNPPKIEAAIKLSYRDILGEQSWNQLHPDIQKRFSVSEYYKPACYIGTMHEVYLSKVGMVLAHCCRLIGTPLALYNGRNIPTTVNVYPNKQLGGMTWDRHYHYSEKKINIVKSTKCITNNKQMIEVVDFGFGMNLKLFEKDKALFFESESFFFKLSKFKIKIPNILSPGKTIVQQKALSQGRFEFSLTVTHVIFGLMYKQVGIFANK